jgi:NTP pyrophosphatase (non-canonical NTP hydrolase)
MDLAALTELMHQFVQSKGWYDPDSLRPQEPSNLAQALAVECSEVLELFAWNREPEKDVLGRELADVALYLLQIASLSGIDLEAAIVEKLRINQDRQWDR